MKILVLENLKVEAERHFKHVNELDFEGSLEVKWISKSQELEIVQNLSEFVIFFIDINLSSKSDKDGFKVIENLQEKGYNNIVIMTGHDVKDIMKEKGINNLDLLKKPIILDELSLIISKYNN